MALLVLPAQTARAEAPHIALTWESPSACAQRADILDALAEALSASTVVDELGVVAKVTGPTSGEAMWTLRLQFSGSSEGERTLSADNCAALAKSAVLVIAIAYDPTTPPPEPMPADPSAPEPAPTPLPPAPPPAPPPSPPLRPARASNPSPAPSPKPPSADIPSSSERPRLGIAGAARGDLGTLPRAALGFDASLRVRWPRWLLVASFGYLPSVEARLAERPSSGGDFSSWTVGFMGCGAPVTTVGSEPRPGDLGLRLCLAGEVGQLRAEGFGVSQPTLGDALLGVVEGVAGFDVWLAGPVTVTADLGFGVPLLRPSFFLSNVGDVHQPAAVRGRLGLGVELTF